MTTREALEAALVATPDDVALHSAYADLLIEDGDPRGEYIRIQLAAEDRNQPAAKLRELEDAAHKLLLQHEREWYGDLWQFVQRPSTAYSVAEPMEPNVSISWRRGWIDGVRVGQLSDELTLAIARNLFTRLLRDLSIDRNFLPATHDDGWPVGLDLSPLYSSGRFRGLRQFSLGSAADHVFADGEVIDEFLTESGRLQAVELCCDMLNAGPILDGDFPALERLAITVNNPNVPVEMLGLNERIPQLRVLYLDLQAQPPVRGDLGPISEQPYPHGFRTLFRSLHLTALEYFTFRNGEFGDAGVEELLASGFVNRLKGLDLCRCNITDDGAQMLAAHPHIPRLEYLHLDNNLLSPIGIDALEAAGVQVSRNQMFGPAVDVDEF